MKHIGYILSGLLIVAFFGAFIFGIGYVVYNYFHFLAISVFVLLILGFLHSVGESVLRVPDEFEPLPASKPSGGLRIPQDML